MEENMEKLSSPSFDSAAQRQSKNEEAPILGLQVWNVKFDSKKTKKILIHGLLIEKNKTMVHTWPAPCEGNGGHSGARGRSSTCTQSEDNYHIISFSRCFYHVWKHHFFAVLLFFMLSCLLVFFSENYFHAQIKTCYVRFQIVTHSVWWREILVW